MQGASSTVARGSNAAPPPETPPGLHDDACRRVALLCAWSGAWEVRASATEDERSRS